MFWAKDCAATRAAAPRSRGYCSGGTITMGIVGVDMALDASGHDSPAVLELAALNAGLQTGYPNPLDAAIMARGGWV